LPSVDQIKTSEERGYYSIVLKELMNI